MYVLVTFACFSDEVVYRLSSQEAFKTFEIGLIKISGEQTDTPNVTVVPTRLALYHLLGLSMFTVLVGLLAYLAEGFFVFVLSTFVAQRKVLRELKIVQSRSY